MHHKYKSYGIFEFFELSDQQKMSFMLFILYGLLTDTLNLEHIIYFHQNIQHIFTGCLLLTSNVRFGSILNNFVLY